MRYRTIAIFLLLSCILAAVPVRAQKIEPNDPDFPNSWALRLIDAPCAWRMTTGSPGVTVAVIDSGVDRTHPDLVGRLRDDGYDFVADDEDPTDENGHGTNIAGIIAATLNNVEGSAGLAPNISILPVRVMNRRGKGSDTDIAAGVRYAADKGARVINLSLGATLTIAAETESEQVSNAIRYAQRQGALVVVAAGNDFVPLPNAIAGNNLDVLVVAATDEEDRLAPFSNYGEWIDISAPGVHIFSTMPTYEVFLTSDEVPRDERFRPRYDYMSGTSQATALVSALAALLFSLRPDWDAQQVAEALKAHAADLGKRNPELVAEGKIGAGRIDACRTAEGAVVPILPTPPPAAGGPSGAPTRPDVTQAPFVAPTTAPARPVPPGAPGEAALETGSSPLALVAVMMCMAMLLFGLVGVFLIGIWRRNRPHPRATPSLYRSVPAALRPAPPAAPDTPRRVTWGYLTVIAGVADSRRYTLRNTLTVIGRAPECDIVLIGDGTVSRRHALVRNSGGRVTIEDSGSSHGTYLNGRRLVAPMPAGRGDVVQLGQTTLRFE